MSEFTNHHEGDFGNPPDSGATCNRCGATGLEWVHTGERWRLIDERGRFHVCKSFKNVADDFEAI